MESTGDPVLDYLEELVYTGKHFHLSLCFPECITPCCDDALRALIKNTQLALYYAKRPFPDPKKEIASFLRGGPRPEIIG